MIRVDIRRLYLNQTLGVVGGRTKSLAKQFRDNLDELRMETRESLQLLRELGK